MTFGYNVNKNCIEYDDNFVAYMNSIDGFRIANKLNCLEKENEQLKQQCKDFMEMLDDMSIAYLVNDGLEEILND